MSEYTVPEIAERYKNLDNTAITELISFPALFAYERVHGLDARLGFIKEIRVRSGRVGFEYGFYSELPPIPAAELDGLRWELDIDELEMNRTHWAVKDVDLLASLIDAGLIRSEQVTAISQPSARARSERSRSQLVSSPQVFSIPEGRPEVDLVAVMMPFDAAFDEVYSSIQEVCADAGLRCLRANDIWEDSTVIQDVFNLLFRTRIVIADFTNRNANVLYETGIAHTLGRALIPMAQSLDHVPFDLRHHRVLKYLRNAQGLAEMKAKATTIQVQSVG
jgi:hypothetical protein